MEVPSVMEMNGQIVSAFRYANVGQLDFAYKSLTKSFNGNDIFIQPIRSDNQSLLFTERVTSIKIWFLEQFDLWKQLLPQNVKFENEKRNWWLSIRPRFCEILRQLIKAVKVAKFGMDTDAFINTKGRVKIFPRNISRWPVLALSQLLVECVQATFSSELDDTDAPDFCILIDILNVSPDYRLHCNSVLDGCFLSWTNKEKADIIIKLYQVGSNKTIKLCFHNILIGHKNLDNWLHQIPARGVVRDVFNFGKNKYLTNGDILSFSRHVLIHCNDNNHPNPLTSWSFAIDELCAAFPTLFSSIGRLILQFPLEMPNLSLKKVCSVSMVEIMERLKMETEL